MVLVKTLGKMVKAVIVERISIEDMIISLDLKMDFIFEAKGNRNPNLLVNKKDFVSLE